MARRHAREPSSGLGCAGSARLPRQRRRPPLRGAPADRATPKEKTWRCAVPRFIAEDRVGRARRACLARGAAGADRVTDGSRRQAPAARGRMATRASPWPPPRGVRCEPSGTRSCEHRLRRRVSPIERVRARKPLALPPRRRPQDRVPDGSQRTTRGGGRGDARVTMSPAPPEPAAVSRPTRDPHHAAPRARQARRSAPSASAPPRSSVAPRT